MFSPQPSHPGPISRNTYSPLRPPAFPFCFQGRPFCQSLNYRRAGNVQFFVCGSSADLLQVGTRHSNGRPKHQCGYHGRPSLSPVPGAQDESRCWNGVGGKLEGPTFVWSQQPPPHTGSPGGGSRAWGSGRQSEKNSGHGRPVRPDLTIAHP